MSFIERVGFGCWKLFKINYFRCYEVIIFFVNVKKNLENTFQTINKI